MIPGGEVKLGGKTVFALYLVLEGYVKIDDENGCTIIVKKDAVDKIGSLDDEDPELDDLPF